MSYVLYKFIYVFNYIGVEAQTITVWKQSEKYKIPKVIFVNKMDRADANVFMSCDSVEKKLECPTIMLQLPVKENNKLLGKLKSYFSY